MRKNRPPQNDASPHIHVFYIYLSSCLSAPAHLSDCCPFPPPSRWSVPVKCPSHVFFSSNLTFSNSLTLHFLVPKPGRLRFPLVLRRAGGAHFPAWAFKTSSRGRPVPAWAVQALCKGCMGFSRTPRNTGRLLSLPLFSTLSFSRDRPTPGQRPFTIQPPSIHHEFSPDPVAQVSSDSTLRHHRLSSFPGSRGTLRPKGPLGRDLGDAPPSFRVSLSLSLAEGLGDDLFSRPDSH